MLHNTQDRLIPGAPRAWDDPAHGSDPGFGLYIHWPFCAKKCPYCDFNSHVQPDVPHDRWRTALLLELDRLAALTPNRTLSTLYFGGGTPSLMDPATTAAIVEAARNHWPGSADPEITLEANPGTVDEARFADFSGAGVNRLSLGVQALNDADLAFLGRIHDANAARSAIACAGKYFQRFSFDLIYARPTQTRADWQGELASAIKLLEDNGGDHLSLYQLTIEKGTAFFGAHRSGAFALPDEDLASDLFDLTRDITGQAGLPRYEVSNHAKPGHESQHNLIYWRGGDWVGIGPGAHSRVSLPEGRRAMIATGTPARWLQGVEDQGSGQASERLIDPEEHADELLMMALRTAEGVNVNRLEALTGRAWQRNVSAAELGQLISEGFLVCDGPWIRATDAGLQVLNAVLARLLD